MIKKDLNELLEKYGKTVFCFVFSYKNQFTYSCEENNFKIFGSALYRGELRSTMTFSELYNNLETFNFYINDEEVFSD